MKQDQASLSTATTAKRIAVMRAELERLELACKQAQTSNGNFNDIEQPQFIDLDRINGLGCLYDADGCCYQINAARSKFTGRSIEQDLGDGWQQTVHPDDMARLLGVMQQAALAQAGYQTSYRLYRSDQSYVLMISTAVPMINDNGVFVGFLESTTTAPTDLPDQRHMGSPMNDQLVHTEFNHRFKNQIAEIEALTHYYLSSSDSRSLGFDAACESINGKLRMIRTVHDLLSQSGSKLVCFLDMTGELIGSCHEKWGAAEQINPERVAISGPGFRLAATDASCLGMCLHELLVNSRKHGVLKGERGTIRLTWELLEAQGSEVTVTLSWVENGPHIYRGSHNPGIGLKLVEGLITGQMQGLYEASLKPEGFRCNMTVRLLEYSTKPE